MVPDNPYKKYQNTQVMTADPGTLLIMLLEGGNRFLRRAKKAMEEQDFEESHKLCVKVEKIIMELINSLDLSYGQLTKNLLSLYEYMYRRLVESNIKKDVSMLAEVEKLLGDMEDMWKEAYKKSLAEGKQAPVNGDTEKQEQGISRVF